MSYWQPTQRKALHWNCTWKLKCFIISSSFYRMAVCLEVVRYLLRKVLRWGFGHLIDHYLTLFVKSRLLIYVLYKPYLFDHDCVFLVTDTLTILKYEVSIAFGMIFFSLAWYNRKSLCFVTRKTWLCTLTGLIFIIIMLMPWYDITKQMT